MSRLFASLIPRLMLLSFLAVLTCAAPALADLLTWNLSGVTLDGGGSVTGSFVYNKVSTTITDWNVTATYGSPSDPEAGGFLTSVQQPFVYNSSNSTAALVLGGIFFETSIPPYPY